MRSNDVRAKDQGEKKRNRKMDSERKSIQEGESERGGGRKKINKERRKKIKKIKKRIP